jgi:hypothetical protein
VNDLFYTPGWMRKAAEERWAREGEAEIRRVQQDMVDAEEQAVLKAREDYYRKRLAERPKLPPTPKPPPEPEPPPVEKPKYRKPDRSKWKRKLLPGENRRNWWAEELLSLISKSKAFSACDQPTYTVDDRIIEEAESWHNHWRVDARDMEWNGYEWSLI